MNTNFRIIDAHCHPLALDGSCSIGRFGSPNAADEFFAEMKRFGVDRCCGSIIRRIPGNDFESVRWFNDQALALRERWPEYTPGVHVHPNFPAESCAELERLHREHGVKWVGELVPYSMGYTDYTTPAMDEILETVQALGMVLNLHEGRSEPLDTIARRFPKLRIVIAHPGDGPVVEERIELLRKYKNVHLDISGTGLFRWGLLRHITDRCGIHKLLFGTDFPVCSIPMQIAGVLGEHLSDAEKEAIFSGNFLRLTGEK